MGTFRAFSVLTWFQKFIVILITLFVLYTFLVFFVLPKIVQDIAEKKLTETLGRQTTISKIIINPYSFLFILKDLNIRTKTTDKSLFALSQVNINFQASSLFKRGPVIKEISVSDPTVHITRNMDGSYNFSDLLPDKTAAQEIDSSDHNKDQSRPLSFFIGNIRLYNGEISIQDLQKDTAHSLTKMNLAIPFISNMDTHTDIFVTPYFAVNFDGSPIELQGKSKPFTDTLTTTMEFRLADLELPKYFAYNPLPTDLDLVDGKLSAFLSLNFSTPDKQASLPQHSISGDITLNNIDIRGLEGTEFFSLDKLQLALSESQILKGIINLDTISISSPKLSLNHNDQGRLNIYNMIPQDQEKKAPEAKEEGNEMAIQVSCKEFNIDDFQVNYLNEEGNRDVFQISTFAVDNTAINSADHEATIGKTIIDGGSLKIFRLNNGTINLSSFAPLEKGANTEQHPEKKLPQWIARVEDFALKNFEIQADDLVDQGKGNITLDNIELLVQQFSNAADHQGNAQINFKVNGSGVLDVAGKVGVSPLQAELDFNTEDIEIEWFQDFISQAAKIIIPDGNITAKGHASFRKDETMPLNGQLLSDITISDFKAIGSNDNRDLIAFNNLALQDIKVEADPFFVDIKNISLKNPSINAVVSEEGQLNFSRIAKTQSSKEDVKGQSETAKVDAAAPFKVDQIILENGELAVHDRSISPNFNTTLTKINSKVTSLSSDAKKQPEFNLRAMVNNHTPLKIDGSVNPLTTNLILDMRMILQDMDLGVFTPYSGKYAGYTIQKGKMTLELDYAINDNQLKAQNEVFLDQFDFGKEVKSEDAVNAPVTLAVALLKDPSGRISLDLPITGNLDDPEFSIGGVVVEMIMNLLVKAATAPFSLLGAMFGGGEDLNILSFEAGTAALGDQETEKVKTLITALTQRPALNLDIGGYANVEMDTPALKQLRLDRQLKSEKLKKLISQGNPITSVEDIQLSEEEYLEYLQTAFATIPQKTEESEINSKLPKNENPNSANTSEQNNKAAATPTKEEMSQALMAEIRIGDDDLRDLAQQRAMVVKDKFILEGNIDASRIHTTAPDTLEPKEESLRSAGVIMTLQ